MKMFKHVINYIKVNDLGFISLDEEIFMKHCEEAIEAYDKLEIEKGQVEHNYKTLVNLFGEDAVIAKLEEEKEEKIKRTNDHYSHWISEIKGESKDEELF
ncbi:hypothetical protein ACU3L3_07555 [Priestia endophytica]